MKQKIYSILLLLFLVFLLINPSYISSRKLATKLGAHLGIKSKKSATEMENKESFLNLMGVEACGNEDEECLKRRALADAHLDYIYTQHHKP